MQLEAFIFFLSKNAVQLKIPSESKDVHQKSCTKKTQYDSPMESPLDVVMPVQNTEFIFAHLINILYSIKARNQIY